MVTTGYLHIPMDTLYLHPWLPPTTPQAKPGFGGSGFGWAWRVRLWPRNGECVWCRWVCAIGFQNGDGPPPPCPPGPSGGATDHPPPTWWRHPRWWAGRRKDRGSGPASPAPPPAGWSGGLWPVAVPPMGLLPCPCSSATVAVYRLPQGHRKEQQRQIARVGSGFNSLAEQPPHKLKCS